MADAVCCLQEKEVLKSSVEETHAMTAVSGRCVVMPYRDDVACRFTEVAERHVFVCESRYNEADKSVSKRFKPNSIIRVGWRLEQLMNLTRTCS